MLVHALIDGSAVSLSGHHGSSSSSSSGGAKHCGGKDSQLRAVLLAAIPFGTAAVMALLLGHSSEVWSWQGRAVGGGAGGDQGGGGEDMRDCVS
jgi:hypothetical protein